MIFVKDNIYHLYNQGNNRQKIFFKRDNYLFFLEKIRKHVLPYADIFAWCLMPNHFHLMVEIKEVELPLSSLGVTQDTALNKSRKAVQSHAETCAGKIRTLNDSIGIMLRSYTRAINKQYNRSGKLFREATKAECINGNNVITPSFFNENGIARINVQHPEDQYPQICFNYIHQNPVKAGLVSVETDWEFSSARDYAGMRNGQLINKKAALKYIVTV